MWRSFPLCFLLPGPLSPSHTHNTEIEVCEWVFRSFTMGTIPRKGYKQEKSSVHSALENDHELNNTVRIQQTYVLYCIYVQCTVCVRCVCVSVVSQPTTGESGNFLSSLRSSTRIPSTPIHISTLRKPTICERKRKQTLPNKHPVEPECSSARLHDGCATLRS